MEDESARRTAVRMWAWRLLIVVPPVVFLAWITAATIDGWSPQTPRTYRKCVGLVIAAAMIWEGTTRALKTVKSQRYPKPTLRHAVIGIGIVVVLILLDRVI